MIASSPLGDISEAARTGRRVSTQSAVTIDDLAFLVLDQGAIVAGFASESRKPVYLRRVTIWTGALCFVRAIRSRAFSSSSLTSIVIPRTVEVIGPECFRSCESLSSVSSESDSLLRRIESKEFSSTQLMSVSLPGDIPYIAANAFPDSCTVSRE
jgi:hypothetical protein